MEVSDLFEDNLHIFTCDSAAIFQATGQLQNHHVTAAAAAIHLMLDP